MKEKGEHATMTKVRDLWATISESEKEVYEEEAKEEKE